MMTNRDSVSLALYLPQHWWHRLQRVAQTCYASPSEFIRESVEAEIVRRELLLEKTGEGESQWFALLHPPTNSPLQ